MDRIFAHTFNEFVKDPKYKGADIHHLLDAYTLGYNTAIAFKRKDLVTITPKPHSANDNPKFCEGRE